MRRRKGLFVRQVPNFINRHRLALLSLARDPDAKEDAEDVRLAKEVLGRIERGEARTYSHEEVWREIADEEKSGKLPT